MWISLIKWFAKVKKRQCLNTGIVSYHQVIRPGRLFFLLLVFLWTIYSEIFQPMCGQAEFFFFYHYLSSICVYLYICAQFPFGPLIFGVYFIVRFILSVSCCIWLIIFCEKLKLKIKDEYLDIYGIFVCAIFKHICIFSCAYVYNLYSMYNFKC